jgi:pilus assembly protein Flp/PilA
MSLDLPARTVALGGLNCSSTIGAWRALLERVVVDDCGQDIVEYALLGALIGIAAVAIWQQLATSVGIAYGATDSTGVQGAVQGLSSCTPDPGGGGC